MFQKGPSDMSKLKKKCIFAYHRYYKLLISCIITILIFFLIFDSPTFDKSIFCYSQDKARYTKKAVKTSKILFKFEVMMA